MDSDHWARAKEIFSEALDHAPEQREAFVRTQCDGQLLRDVLKLLEGYSRADEQLSQPVFPNALGGGASERPPAFLSQAVVAGRFRIARLIARGGMGDVYEAEDQQLGIHVALKTIRPDIASVDAVLDLFKNEIQTARRVTHPNVCRIYDLFQHSDTESGQTTVFLTMELLTGGTLADRLKLNGAFSGEEALPLIGQLAAALQAAHDAGVIHRDFKPGNVILSPTPDRGFRAVVTDFGLALGRRQEKDESLPGAAGGTPDYMAPEQRTGGEVTAATDVYAFGLVIAEMMGARVKRDRPSQRRTLPHIGLLADHGSVRMSPAFRRWQPVVRQCLESDPAKRFARPMSVFEALTAAANPRWAQTRARAMARRAAIVTVLVGLTTLVAQRYGRNTNPVTYRKLGNETNTVLRPSPDGRYFAVMDDATGNLGLSDVSTGEVRLLTNRSKNFEVQVLSAVFSPDGNRVAYAWMQADKFELHMIDRRTAEDTLLNADPGLTYCDVEDWSPDGSRIAVELVTTETDRIAVISVADKSVSFLEAKGPFGRMAFTPDSTYVVFSASPNAQTIETEIFEVPVQGGPVTALIQGSFNDKIIGFSRDGRRMIFSSDRKGTHGVWAVPYSNGEVRGAPAELAHDLGRASDVGLTEDEALYYTVTTSSTDVYNADIDAVTGGLLSPPMNVMKRYQGTFLFPTWSPDGRKMSFISTLETKSEIWIHSIESGESRRLQTNLANFQRPQWDPSGDRIFVKGRDRSGRRGIFRVDADSGTAELVIDERSLNGFEGVWTHDGRTLFDRFSDPKAGIFRLDVATGQRQVLYVPPPGLDLGRENLALSPDESTLAFQARQKQSGKAFLMVIPTAGGVARDLLAINEPEQFSFGSFAWLGDSKQILTARTRDDKSELWLVPTNGDRPRKVDFPEMRVTQLRMNPNGRTIAFTSGKPSSEVWVAENLLQGK